MPSDLLLGAMPAPGVPVAPRAGISTRHDDLVALTGADVVVAARASIGLHGLVRLDVANVDGIGVVVGPVVIRHRSVGYEKDAQASSASTTTSAAPRST